jgi:hypothetical protein
LIRPPLIVYEHGDLEMFRDPTSLEQCLEPIDIENEEYVVYDSEGRLLQLGTHKVPVRMLFGLLRGTVEAVKITGVVTDPVHAKKLEARIRDYLDRQQSKDDQGTESLAELVERLQAQIGFVT